LVGPADMFTFSLVGAQHKVYKNLTYFHLSFFLLRNEDGY